MAVEKLSVVAIIVDRSVQPRVRGLDEAHVEDLRAAYESGDEVPRVTVWKVGHVCKLSRGFHRIEGARRAGLKHLVCEVHVGTEAEWKLDAFTSNADHGLKRTPEDIRRAVVEITKLFPDWSDRRLAESLKVSHHTVAKYRPQLGTVPSSQSDKREGKDGKVRSMPRPADKADVDQAVDAAVEFMAHSAEQEGDPVTAARLRAEHANEKLGDAIRPPEPDPGLFDPSPLVAAVEQMIRQWSATAAATKSPKAAAAELERLARSLMEQAAMLRAA
jgi:hypothetical protein